MLNLLVYISLSVVIAAISAVLLLYAKTRKIGRFSAILLAVLVLAEVFAFNFHSFHLLGGSYPYRYLSLDDENVTVSGINSEGRSEKGGTITVLIQNINAPVGTLVLDLDFATSDSASINIAAKDVTQSASFRSSVATATATAENDASRYVVLDLSGDVSELRVKITAPEKHTVIFRGVELNSPVPFSLSPVRLILIYAAVMLLYLLITLPGMHLSLEENGKTFRRAAVAVIAAFLLLGTALGFSAQYGRSGSVISGFKQTTGNQISRELVDAFEAGQVSLLAEPSAELLALDNPYDWSLRSAEGVSAKWDHLLYNGKYYSYYGIAPVLLLFLPYHAVTGYYFPSDVAILGFSLLGLLFLGLLFLEFARKFCRRVSVGMLLSSLIILMISSGAWYNLAYANFYEIAQSSGFCFTAMGFYFLLRSNVVGEGKIRHPSLVLSSTALSLAVLCRPTLALYCITALFFLGYGFFKRKAALQEQFPKDKKPRTRGMVSSGVAALLPFVLIGGVQMVYNFARFGSFFDFGIEYSLTINDFTRSQYHTDFVMIGLYNFLVAFPILKPEFPYIFSNFSKLSVNGYYYVANQNAVGILWRALPSLGFLGVGGAWKTLDKSEKRKALLLWLPVSVVAPLIIICSIWESGYGVRYCCDFAWQIILGGMSVLYLLYARCAEGQTKKLMTAAFAVAALWSLGCNGAMLYDYFV